MTWRGIIYTSAKLALKSHVMARRDRRAIGWSYPTRIPPHQGSSHLCISEGTIFALCTSSSSRLKFSRRKSVTVRGLSFIKVWRNVATRQRTWVIQVVSNLLLRIELKFNSVCGQPDFSKVLHWCFGLKVELDKLRLSSWLVTNKTKQHTPSPSASLQITWQIKACRVNCTVERIWVGVYVTVSFHILSIRKHWF